MRRITFSIVLISFIIFFVSCARGITPEQAANGKAKCGKTYIR